MAGLLLYWYLYRYQYFTIPILRARKKNDNFDIATVSKARSMYKGSVKRTNKELILKVKQMKLRAITLPGVLEIGLIMQ